MDRALRDTIGPAATTRVDDTVDTGSTVQMRADSLDAEATAALSSPRGS